MADTAGATKCQRCDVSSSVLFDGCCAFCWSHVEVGRLRDEVADLKQQLDNKDDSLDDALNAVAELRAKLKQVERDAAEARAEAAERRGEKLETALLHIHQAQAYPSPFYKKVKQIAHDALAEAQEGEADD